MAVFVIVPKRINPNVLPVVWPVLGMDVPSGTKEQLSTWTAPLNLGHVC